MYTELTSHTHATSYTHVSSNMLLQHTPTKPSAFNIFHIDLKPNSCRRALGIFFSLAEWVGTWLRKTDRPDWSIKIIIMLNSPCNIHKISPTNSPFISLQVRCIPNQTNIFEQCSHHKPDRSNSSVSISSTPAKKPQNKKFPTNEANSRNQKTATSTSGVDFLPFDVVRKMWNSLEYLFFFASFFLYHQPPR